MLTEKDYCDYDTCVALKELGFSEPTLAYYHGFLSSKPLLYLVIDEDCMPKDGVNVFDLLSNSNKYKDSKNIDAPTMWEAQKWLREERGINIFVMQITIEGSGMHRYASYIQLGDKIWLCRYYSLYEEALLEGIKEAVKILKENK